MPAGAERSKDPPDPPILLPLLRGFSGAVRFPLVALASLALSGEEDRNGSSSALLASRCSVGFQAPCGFRSWRSQVSLYFGEEDLRRIEEDRPLGQRQEKARGSPKEKQSIS